MDVEEPIEQCGHTCNTREGAMADNRKMAKSQTPMPLRLSSLSLSSAAQRRPRVIALVALATSPHCVLPHAIKMDDTPMPHAAILDPPTYATVPPLPALASGSGGGSRSGRDSATNTYTYTHTHIHIHCRCHLAATSTAPPPNVNANAKRSHQPLVHHSTSIAEPPPPPPTITTMTTTTTTPSAPTAEHPASCQPQSRRR
jgi:hypothetical protein